MFHVNHSLSLGVTWNFFFFFLGGGGGGGVEMSLDVRTSSPTGQVCSLFLRRLPMSELDSPVLEPDLNLMFRKSEVQ